MLVLLYLGLGLLIFDALIGMTYVIDLLDRSH